MTLVSVPRARSTRRGIQALTGDQRGELSEALLDFRSVEAPEGA